MYETKEIMHLPLGCLQDGTVFDSRAEGVRAERLAACPRQYVDDFVGKLKFENNLISILCETRVDHGKPKGACLRLLVLRRNPRDGSSTFFDSRTEGVRAEPPAASPIQYVEAFMDELTF